ncbi:MAG: hypothetical protein DI551_04590 [Micavibrio aeruginosavorus]|uniref:DUF2155 domain-containing protein n=1 Tax=Micavibrio aeruginosavorus TaxID=349221 RepID=A0A2W5PPZ8_9BACT|nr:MAG: hypothetical protein DI551_04590 [Micavibrio aeruginosavorus]
MEDYPSVKLQGLDKSVGRTVTFEAKVGSTIQYGSLFIKIQACRKAPPIEKPESAAFLQIWEVPPGGEKSEWSFSGWMFASSPALSAMDHPVYDVWVLDCLGKQQPNEEAKAAESNAEADQTNLPAPDAKTDVNAATPADPATQETAPQTQEQEPIPTDSEAEEPAPAEQPPVQQQPIDPDAAYYPQIPQTQNEAPAPYYGGEAGAVRPQDPTSGDGMTAYDFMKQQQGTNAQPRPQQQAPQTYQGGDGAYYPSR